MVFVVEVDPVAIAIVVACTLKSLRVFMLFKLEVSIIV